MDVFKDNLKMIEGVLRMIVCPRWLKCIKNDRLFKMIDVVLRTIVVFPDYAESKGESVVFSFQE